MVTITNSDMATTSTKYVVTEREPSVTKREPDVTESQTGVKEPAVEPPRNRMEDAYTLVKPLPVDMALLELRRDLNEYMLDDDYSVGEKAYTFVLSLLDYVGMRRFCGFRLSFKDDSLWVRTTDGILVLIIMISEIEERVDETSKSEQCPCHKDDRSCNSCIYTAKDSDPYCKFNEIPMPHYCAETETYHGQPGKVYNAHERVRFADYESLVNELDLECTAYVALITQRFFEVQKQEPDCLSDEIDDEANVPTKIPNSELGQIIEKLSDIQQEALAGGLAREPAEDEEAPEEKNAGDDVKGSQ